MGTKTSYRHVLILNQSAKRVLLYNFGNGSYESYESYESHERYERYESPAKINFGNDSYGDFILVG